MSVNTRNISVIPYNLAPFLLQFLLLHTVRLDTLFSSFLLLSVFRYDIAVRITYRSYRLNKETEKKRCHNCYSYYIQFIWLFVL